MIGREISHYRITERISSGATGIVYKAEDLTLGRTVAIKVIKPSHENPHVANKRFLREAQAVSQIEHPNVVSVFEVFQHGSANYMVMQYAPGSTLRARLETRDLPLGDALRVVGGAAAGLHAAHVAGVVHRDVKPENIVVDDEGDARVLDFGVAHLVDRSTLTRRGRIVGTLPYMAPEQIRGEAVDARTDVYALGAVLYELIAGRPPFEDRDESTLFYRINNTDPVRLRALVPDVPPAVERIVVKAMAKKPRYRYRTAAEMRRAIEGARRRLGTGAAGCKPSRRAPGRRFRVGSLVGAAAVLVAMIVMVAVFRGC